MIDILGTGSYLPSKVLTNFDLSKIVDTSDEWITKRTGIRERRVVVEGEEATSDLALHASLKAIEMANIKKEDIDMIIVGTSTPDYQIPACAPILQAKLGLKDIPAFDLNSVCSSFSYGFSVANSILVSGAYKKILLVGADTYSTILNWNDRTSCVIFGDGAGAVILEKSTRDKLLSLELGAYGDDYDMVRIKVGGSKHPITKNPHQYDIADTFFYMEGKRVYEFAITLIPEVIERLLKKSNLKIDDIDLVVLHQANIRIIEMVAKSTDIPLDKFFINIQKIGNTSSGSIPIALDEAVRQGRIKKGSKVLSIGFGGGLSWGGFLLEW